MLVEQWEDAITSSWGDEILNNVSSVSLYSSTIRFGVFSLPIQYKKSKYKNKKIDIQYMLTMYTTSNGGPRCGIII